MKIAIVDDHQIVREGLRMCLSAAPRHSVVGEAADGAAGLDLIQKQKPDAVLLDIAMPKLSGIEVLRRIKTLPQPHPAVLMLSMHSDPEFVAEALREGARGYVPKSSAFQELLKALDEIEAGKNYTSPTLGDVNKVEAPTADLTPRERQVLELLASGLSTKQTAAQLGLSDKTVHAFRSRLMAKLGVRTLQELTKFAIRHGITSV